MLIGMFHAKTLKRHKERMSDSLIEEQGVCRVVCASTALGMGVNLQGIRQVIHYGPPHQVDDLSRKMEGQDLMVDRQDLYYYFMAFT